MKVYTYKPEEVRHIHPTDYSPIRLAGAVEVTPDEAEIFISPVSLHNFNSREVLKRLHYFKEYEHRHVFFCCAEHDVFFNTEAILIRCDARTWMYSADPNTISWPWPVEDWGDDGSVLGHEDIRYDASFHGWLSNDTRKQALTSCQKTLGKRFDGTGYRDFYGYVHRDRPEEAQRRKDAYRASLRSSLLTITPESRSGVLPYRFFEGLVMGRPPVLFSTNYVLPFADRIPWDEFVFLHEAKDAKHAGEIVAKIVKELGAADILRRGRAARFHWEKYLDSRVWSDRFSTVCKAKVKT